MLETLLCIWKITTLIKKNDKHIAVYQNSIRELVTVGGTQLEQLQISDTFDVMLKHLADGQGDLQNELPGISGVEFKLTAENQDFISKISRNDGTSWEEWVSLKEADRLDLAFHRCYNEFRQDLGPWMKWHIKVSKIQDQELVPADMGVQYEQMVGISLVSKAAAIPNTVA